MYKILLGDRTIFDDVFLEDYPMLEARANFEVNTAGSISLKAPISHIHYERIVISSEEIKLFKDNKLIFKGRIMRTPLDFYKTKSVDIDGKLSYFNDSIKRPFEFTGSPTKFFSELIENHNSQVDELRKFKVGTVTVKDNNDYIRRSSEDYHPTWYHLKKLVGSLGGYMVVRYEEDGDYLDWLEDFPYTNAQKIEFSKNLINLTHEVAAEETYSACIPLGKKDEETKEYVTVTSINHGSDIIFNQNKVDEIGWRFAPPEKTTWENVTIPENLKKKAEKWLNNQGVMLNETLELDSVDLSYADKNIESFDFGKYIHIISKPHNLEKLYLLSKVEIDFLHPENTKISLGEKKKTLYDSLRKASDNLENVKESLEIKTGSLSENISEAIQEIHDVASSISQTAEEITLSLIGNYATIGALEEQRKHFENLLKVNEDGFNFEFSQLKERLTDIGNEIEIQKEWIRLINGEIQIGKSDSPITSVYTNDALEFRYNGSTVARFTNEYLEVRNIAVKNQLKFGDKWAIRPGQYVYGKGYNLNDVWLGGR